MFKVSCWDLGHWSADAFLVNTTSSEQAENDVRNYIQNNNLDIPTSDIRTVALVGQGVVDYYHLDIEDKMRG